MASTTSTPLQIDELFKKLSHSKHLTRSRALTQLEFYLTKSYNRLFKGPHNVQNGTIPIHIDPTTTGWKSHQATFNPNVVNTAVQMPSVYNSKTGIPLPSKLQKQLFQHLQSSHSIHTTPTQSILDTMGPELDRLSGVPTGIAQIDSEAPPLIARKLPVLPFNEERLKWLESFHSIIKKNIDAESWQTVYACFASASLLIKIQTRQFDFFLYCLNQCKLKFEHPEPRVRLAVGETLHSLAMMELFHLHPDGGNKQIIINNPLFYVYRNIISDLYRSIDDNFIRHKNLVEQDTKKGIVPDRDDTPKSNGGLSAQAKSNKLALNAQEYYDGDRGASLALEDDPLIYKEYKSKQTSKMHDTEGWRSLESSFKALQQLMTAYGGLFAPLLISLSLDTKHPLSLISRATTAVKHTNRYVREVGFLLLGTLCQIASLDKGIVDKCPKSDPRHKIPQPKPVFGIQLPHSHILALIAPELTELLAVGLEDNWSQVRFAASVATRYYMDSIFRLHGQYYSQFKQAFEELHSKISVEEAMSSTGFTSDQVPFELGPVLTQENAELLAQGVADLGESNGANGTNGKINPQMKPSSVAPNTPLPNQIPSPLDIEPVYRALLPRMCLNRYYLAAGVRKYSNQTWRSVTQGFGPDLLGYFIDETVNFFINQTNANNHAVRQASCYVIRELATKIPKHYHNPKNVILLLDALITCFKDGSWTVREAACSALADFVQSFPQVCQSQVDTQIFEMWKAHLSDNIWSVRESAAIALGKACLAYTQPAEWPVVSLNPTFKSKCLLILDSHLESVFKQEKDSTLFDNLENVTQFGVAAAKLKQKNASHVHSHEDKSLFSCGSLAPKIPRGTGCMDHGFTRDKQPWELTDGAIYLFRELAQIPDFDMKKILVQHFLLRLTDIAQLESSITKEKVAFHHEYLLFQTFTRQIGIIHCYLLGLEDGSNTAHYFTTRNPLKKPNQSPLYSECALSSIKIIQGLVGRILAHIMMRPIVECASAECLNHISMLYGPNFTKDTFMKEIVKRYPVEKTVETLAPDNIPSDSQPETWKEIDSNPLIKKILSTPSSSSVAPKLTTATVYRIFSRCPHIQETPFALVLKKNEPPLDQNVWIDFLNRNYILSSGNMV